MFGNSTFDRLDNAEALVKVTSETSPLTVGFSTHVNENDSSFDFHYELEVGVVLSGEMERILPEYRSLYKPGDVWLSGIWEPHGYLLKSTPVEVLVFLFRPEFLTEVSLGYEHDRDWLELFIVSPGSRPQIKTSERKEILKIVDLFFKNRDAGIEDTPSVRLALLLILDKLFTFWDSPVKAYTGKRKMQTILPALELVFQSKSFLSAKEAADLCALSESTFERHFSKAIGISFGRFAMNHRLKHCAYLLRKTDIPIKAVSNEWGFSDLSHFYKTFKKIFQMTPSEYRNYYKSNIKQH